MTDKADVIEYDVEVLGEMTQKQLAIQVIARQDLFFPHRKEQLDTSALKAEIIAAAKAKLAEIVVLGIPDLSDSLAAIIESYEDSP